ncbi:DUF2306 domain-containing protein [Fimbriiglobus ruber]|uniref:DUF2306 domain-containing protein n=1 Tax=Fimbriiglobus ruber TaxID=1908690 RepID=A0A225DV87_9BACT|nr:DUF2306 domain-containing protein [Fimbriiglobus ruber]OWK45440.1 hypothetical protein FRUB_01771 [Fimbriiglobus ruber]
MRRSHLATIVRWLAALLILRVLVAILANYSDYFPPNFDSLFLEGRETRFVGSYPPAFYVHIFSGPFVLLNGLILMSETVRRRYGGLHRYLGRIQVAVLLAIMLPSSVVISRHAFGGWPAGLSFLALSAATATCAVAGVVAADRHRFDLHRWCMLRCYVLICSAVTLRLISGAAGLIGVPNAEGAYIAAAWSSWLIPLALCTIVERLTTRRPAADMNVRKREPYPSNFIEA